ncbi:MAG: hypothetical protein UT13_C0001G0175 [Candidatus Pacebacteria bacterium GW2011_GWF2_38_9]|nr:MAG: hypothetical protein US01_C0001G0176 [candidate division TM6 bacterium GW2011_GWF2_28_16]KKQ09884.1 MAG: hypothetical protein US20_C0004G0023 [Candidatus Pacebacteria bacterium GW2011_GWF1_36_5]KKQ88528.1 MAG: hypothetical protein UT13_C0001G0175 [Candidatus Pacebacteria bacterium GW2011_GWF2_38_9]HAZ73337.1 hypothetical protein [Candidatus Paceibacterota bacterium]
MSKKLQNFLPYIFPLIAIILVVVMFARWYKGKTAEAPVSLLDSQLEVESLPVDVQDSIIKGATDYSMIDMQGSNLATGELRYQIKDDKLSFTVTANLQESKEDYAVWLVDSASDAKKRVFNLKYSKAGYIGSAMVPANILSVEVVVAKASDLMLEDVLLHAELLAPEAN